MGLRPIPSDRVLRQSSSARNSNWLDSLHLVNRRFTVFTAFSAFLLDCGWYIYGDDVVCLDVQGFANTANSADVTRTSRMQYLTKTAFISLMTSHDVAVFRQPTSM